MSNVFDRKKPVEKAITEQNRPIHQSDILPDTIKQRHIQDMVIKRGLDADKITDGSTHTLAYFATDTNKLYIWNGSSVVSTTLS